MAFTVFGNGSDIVHWQPDPKLRGTFDILSTCIVTTLLCVWTAIHLNLPRPEKGKSQGWNQALWLLLALIAPELVAYTAYNQRQRAKKIVQHYNKTFALPMPAGIGTKFYEGLKKIPTILGFRKALKRSATFNLEDRMPNDATTTSEPERYPWTMTHGFYAVMGGFQYTVPTLPPELTFLPSQSAEDPFKVTVDGLYYLMKNEESRSEIPNISEIDIMSKSRATHFTKILVCIQVFWFCVQCATRLAQNLPISLLELNTFGHCICAFIIYIIWWEKPYDVESGTPIISQSLLAVRALKWMSRNRTEETGKMLEHLQKTDIRTQIPSVELDLVSIQKNQATAEVPMASLREDLRPYADDGELLERITLKAGEVLSGTGFKVLSTSILKSTSHLVFATARGGDAHIDMNRLPEEMTDVTLDVAAIVRWRLAWRAICANKVFTGYPRRLVHSLTRKDRNRAEETLQDRSHLSARNPLQHALVLAGLLYGGLHVLAWNAHFSTWTEQLLWRVSSCLVTGGGATIVAAYSLGLYSDIHGLFALMFWLVELPVALIYTLARIYLVVECFINLSHMPAGVYQLPNWSTYFPHIT